MQILVEQSLLNAVGLEWTGIQGTGLLPAAPPSHLALRNHALLVHRLEADKAASELTCCTTSLSGSAIALPWLFSYSIVSCSTTLSTLHQKSASPL